MSKRDPLLTYELDKAGGAWVLTAWLGMTPPIALRLKISDYTEIGAACTVICEVRMAGRTEFQHAATFSADVFDMLEICVHHPDWGDVPADWRRWFRKMLHRLARVMLVVDVAPCEGERYPAEPLSSRDYRLFGPADDLRKQS